MTSKTPSSKKPKEENDHLKTMRQSFRRQLSSLKEMFPGWTEEDLLHTLIETEGDVELAVGRISEGHAHQWGEVKSRKGRKEMPAKPAVKAAVESTRGTGSTRGGFSGRGRGGYSGRGGRAYVPERTLKKPTNGVGDGISMSESSSPKTGTSGEIGGWNGAVKSKKDAVVEEPKAVEVPKTSWAQIVKPKVEAKPEISLPPKLHEVHKASEEPEVVEAKKEVKKEEKKEEKEEVKEEVKEEKTIVEKLEEVAEASPPKDLKDAKEPKEPKEPKDLKETRDLREIVGVKPPNLSEKFAMQFGSISLSSQSIPSQEPARYEAKPEYPVYAPRTDSAPYNHAPQPIPPQQEITNFPPNIPQYHELGNLYSSEAPRGFYDQPYPTKYENSASPPRQPHTQAAPGNPQGYNVSPYVPMYYMSNQYGGNVGGYSTPNSFHSNMHSGYKGGNFGYAGKPGFGYGNVPFDDHTYNGTMHHSAPTQEFRMGSGSFSGNAFSPPAGKFNNEGTMYVQAASTPSSGAPANGQAPPQNHSNPYLQQHSVYQPMFNHYVQQQGSNAYPSNYQMQFQYQQRAGSQQQYWQG